ncbi:DNA-binding domain-containing protein [Parabacteroides sp.]|uniref:DNA-binding domain-containing protein n=1 Tax=Parabacteroides sp. TaxID=1869337 RepID=UPI00257EB39F|nr:DNA-binding domain-containing protein [Parabacteroides sp.]
MKHILKGWLTDNSITTDNKTDKFLLLESAGKMSLEDILQKMFEANTGLQPETLRHVVELYHRIVKDAILGGMQVNTGLFYAVAKFVGVVEGGKWNPEKNSIYVSLTQGQEMREEIAQTGVSILGTKADVMYILETEDRKSGRKDGSATAGRNLFVRGAMLKVAGEDPSVGITLTSSNDAKVTKLEDDLITINKPSELTLLLPAELAEGEYTLTITTQYSRGKSPLLKEPRSVSTTVYIGGKPDEGGSGKIDLSDDS